MLKRIPFAEHPTIWQGLQACYECQDVTGANIRSIYRTREGVATTDASNLTTNGHMRKALDFIVSSTTRINLTGILEKTVGEIFKVGKPFSVAHWIRPSVITSLRFISGSSNTTSLPGHYIGQNTNKAMVALLDGTNYRIIETTSASLSVGTWVHTIFTYGGGAIDTDWNIYIDGISVPRTIIVSGILPSTITSPTKKYLLGGYDGSATYQGFLGGIEQHCIWNRELNPAEASWLAEGHVSDQSWKQVA